MKTLGVTGGIGSGKTTVCRLLEARGATVFYADEEGRRILQEDPMARTELVEAFGARAYRADGTLDRAWVASRVFGDAEAVARINRIVHPRVRAAFDLVRRDAEAAGVPVLVKETALLLDSGGAEGLDAVLVVTAPEEDRVNRVTARDGSDAGDVRRRMAHQRSDADFLAAGDYVLPNAGSPGELEAMVEAFWREFTAPPRPAGLPPVPPGVPRWGNAFTRWFGRTGLRLMRFRIVADLPDLKQFVVIGAPHTTNWDFVVAMLLLFTTGIRIHWLGKHTIFRWPFGGFMRALGGIPVDRRQAADIVGQAVAQFRTHERFALGLSPEGTRSRTERWKSGFYRIATTAGVPIILGVIDFRRRELRLGEVFHPTGDYEADLVRIRAIYRPDQAKYPEKF